MEVMIKATSSEIYVVATKKNRVKMYIGYRSSIRGDRTEKRKKGTYDHRAECTVLYNLRRDDTICEQCPEQRCDETYPLYQTLNLEVK